MNKNKKLLFLSLTLIMLISCVGVVSASNETDTDTGETIIVSDVPSIEDESADIPIEDDTITERDYYVSDSTGSDDNTGTQDSPYKTIQTALNQTRSEKVTYNIHILEGTYTGLGNTNLTVNGNYNINIIGEGMNKTIIDGEAKFDVQTSGFYWGSSDVWFYYVNDSGNWGMNISSGEGKITLTDMTLTHCWSPGADNINAYPHATIDNYGNLEVDNVYFYENYAGVGAGIRNNANATLLVNNSLFKENKKSSSTGNYGAGVYNKGNATIINSMFDKNYARWGVVTNDNFIIVGNCTFQNGIGYDGSSTYKYGTGVAFNTGGSDFYLPGNIATSNIIENCTFINNYQSDIYGLSGYMLSTNNTFINTSRIYLSDSTNNQNATYTITNNKFINPVASTLQSSLSTGSNTYAIQSSVRYNPLLIENNTIEMTNGTAISAQNAIINNNNISFSGSGIAIALSMNNAHVTNNNITGGNITLVQANNTIINNTISTNSTAGIIFNNNNAKNNVITGNNITSNSTYAIKLYRTASGNNITDNYLVSNPYMGNSAVQLGTGENRIENNLPESPSNGIFAIGNVTGAKSGSLEDPTSIADALTKLTDDVNTIYLLTNGGNFKVTTPLVINSNNVATKNIIITGFKGMATISGDNAAQILNIADDYTVTVTNVSFVDGLAEYGAAIYTEGNLTVENSSFIEDKATAAGGAVFVNKTGNLVLNNNEFTNINSADETIYFNSTGTITVTGNIYDNCSIKLNDFTISADDNNPSPVKVNDTVKFGMGTVTLENPTWYDSDITNDITYDIYKDDVLIDSITENIYEIIPINPETFTTYVSPTFTTDKSNILITDVYYPNSRIVNMSVEDIVVFENGNAEFAVTLIDEFNLTVKEGTVSYYNGTNLLGTSTVENGETSFTLPVTTSGLSTITVVYNDSTAYYSNATEDMSLVILDNVYVSPDVTEVATGLRNDPTTIYDALSKVKNGKSIIFLDGTYKLNDTIRIFHESTTNATNFSMIGETSNAVLDTEHLAQIMNIEAGLTIYIENLTFTNGNASNGASIQNAGKLTINNSKFSNGYTTSSSGAIYNNGGTLNIYNTEFINNNGDTGGITYSTGSYGVTVDNCTFINNTARGNGLFYSNSNPLTITNSNFINSTTRGPILYAYRTNLTVINSTFDNNNAYDKGIFENDGMTSGSNNDVYMTITNCTVTNNYVNNTAAIAYITGHVTATISDNIFENNTARSGGIYANSAVTNVIINNNSFKNIKTNDETNYLRGATAFTLSGNTYENCTIGYNVNIALSDDTTTPIKVNDTLTVNIKNMALTYPTWYDSNLLDSYTYNTFLNDEQVGTIESEETSYTITPTKAGDTTTYVTTSFSNKESNKLTFDVQNENLKNTVISANTVQGNLNEGTTITVKVTDKEGNLVEDGGVVSLYDEEGILLGSGATVDGIVDITTSPITQLGNLSITVMYNTSSVYNNQTNTTTIIGVMKDVYISPDVEDAATGTIDDPTTLIDALTKVANEGTIHVLKGTSGIYFVTSRVPLTDGISDLTKEFTINGEEEGVAFDGNDTVTIFGLNSGYTVTISNLTFENGGYNTAYGGAIYNNGANLILVDNKFIDCYGINGGFIQTSGNLTINNCSFENAHATNGGAIYANGAKMVLIENSTFNNINASSTSTSSTPYGGAIYSRNSNTTLNNNTFNNLYAQRNGGFVYLYGGNITITNNIISNVISPNETNFKSSGNFVELSGNTYINCSIETTELTIESDKTDLNVNEEGIITLNNITLTHPDWYDADLLDNSVYEIYVNNVSVGNAKGNNVNILFKNKGTFEVVAKESFLQETSNAITFTIVQIETEMTVDPVVGEAGDKLTLTAHVTDTDGNLVNEGKVIFKVNGATLKGEDGKPLYGYVKDGIATIEYTAQKGWANKDVTLSATYSGNNKYTSTQANNTVNITLKTAELKVITDKTEYQSGSTIQLTAIVKDNHNKLVQDGTVIFKLNGVTLKDENGKTLTATVNNGVAQITYSLGTLSVKDYTVTAVLSNKNFNKAEANNTFTITKGTIHVEADAVIVTNDTPAVLTGKIFDSKNNLITRPVKVTVKINGITFVSKVTVNNGTINIPLNESVSGSTSIDNFKMNRIYNVLIIVGENSQYNSYNATTVLVKQ